MSPTPRPRTRKDGVTVWQVPFRLDSRQTSETFDTERQARDFAKRVERDGPAAAREWLNITDSSAGDVTLAEYATAHVDALTGIQEGTRDRYRAYIRNDLGELADLPLDAITDKHIGRWVNRLASAGAAGKTIANKHGFVAAVFERAVAEKIVPASPCARTRLPSTVREPMVFLTHAEFARFLDCFEPRWHPLVTTLFATGLRWGEASALQVGDVDLDAATITVSRAWKSGAGRRIGPPKTEKSRRTVAIPPELVTTLRPLVTGRPVDAWLFTNGIGGPVRGQSFHEGAWDPAVKLANGEPQPRRKIRPLDPPLGKRPRIHDARHSCASWLLNGGAPMIVVQHHLGHESITTTSDRYGHLMPDSRRAVATVMSAALAGAFPQIEA